MFKNMKVRTKLSIGFTVVVLLALTLGAMSFKQTSTVNTLWQNFEMVTLEKKNAIATAYINLGDAIHHFKNYILRGGDYDKQFLSDLETLDKIASAYHKTGSISQEEEQLLKAILGAPRKRTRYDLCRGKGCEEGGQRYPPPPKKAHEADEKKDGGGLTGR